MPRLISFMCYLSFGDNPDSNHYAAPIPIIPSVFADSFKLYGIEYCPIFGEGDRTILDLDSPFPWQHYVPNEYDQKVREGKGGEYRRDIKPYRVSQPEGASVGLCRKVR